MKQFRNVLFLVITLMVYVNICKAEETSIILTKISDGDTIKALVDGKEEKIRLLDIDCYETQKIQRAIWQSEYYHLSIGDVIKKGQYSKQRLEDLLKHHKELTLKWNKRDKYRRILGEVYLDDGTSINKYMLKQGGCERYIDRHQSK